MRFDDMLQTIMDQPLNNTAEKTAVWRQLVDCIAQDKGQHAPDLLKKAYHRLIFLNRDVPSNIRLETVLSLTGQHLPPLLVKYFSCDISMIAAPLISSVQLSPKEWMMIIPALRQPIRHILRQRPDLDPQIIQALDSLGNDQAVLEKPVLKTENKTDYDIDNHLNIEEPSDEENNLDETNSILKEEKGISSDIKAYDLYRKEFFKRSIIKTDNFTSQKENIKKDTPKDSIPKSFADTIRSDILGQKDPEAASHYRPFSSNHISDDKNDEDSKETKNIPAFDKDNDSPRFSPFSDRWQTRVTPVTEDNEDDPIPKNSKDNLDEAESFDTHKDEIEKAKAQKSEDLEWFPTPKRRVHGTIRKLKSNPFAGHPKNGRASDENDETQIRHLLERIDAFKRSLESRAEQFNFETNPSGFVTYVKGISSTVLVGISLSTTAFQNGYGVDGQVVGAFGRRAPIRHARLSIPGNGAASGEWRISAAPFFNPETGHFSGYRGTARRPRIEETAQPFVEIATPRPSVLEIDRDSLRQLVHELRNPLNAIVGFSEMISNQMLGPVNKAYRSYAEDITRQGERLLQAVEDLNSAADIDAPLATSLKTDGLVNVTKIISALHKHYQSAASRHNGDILFRIATGLPLVKADPVAVERLFSRLLTMIIGLIETNEKIEVIVNRQDSFVGFMVKRPLALQDYDEQALLDPGFNLKGEWPHAPVLGLGFALRLIRNLAAAAQGQFEIKGDSFTILLPIEEIRSEAC
ncbi:MAG: HAMP domain-containing sensor histidine kinase [Zymomonas mobilis subsp. pomaceae]|uniref:sensor histidine kinase n=1 Tax=Zymomonas mobilis TaxID=542 RepID=UPI0039ECF853